GRAEWRPCAPARAFAAISFSVCCPSPSEEINHARAVGVKPITAPRADSAAENAGLSPAQDRARGRQARRIARRQFGEDRHDLGVKRPVSRQQDAAGVKALRWRALGEDDLVIVEQEM